MECGLDPISLPAVIPTGDQKKRYTVIEGNRRVVALKALETPSLVSPVLNTQQAKRLNNLARRFSQNPISTVSCVLFESERELEHWVTLRHTGQNNGIGLVSWGAEEKDRYTARHGYRSSAGQILDFVQKHGYLSEEARNSDKGIITSLTRLINTPRVRKLLGIEISNGQVLSPYPTPEVAKSLSRVVEDLKTEQIRVGDIYHAQDRIDYAKALSASDLPDPSTQLTSQKLLNVEDDGSIDTTEPGQRSKRKTTRRKAERTALIPKDCQLDIDTPRINEIYNELLSLSVNQYPNACSVLLRVFVELSVDNYIVQHSLMKDKERNNAPLAKRLKTVAADLQSKGTIDPQLKTAVQKVADSQFVLAASTVTFNQYVHNLYVLPQASELKRAWDELQQFMEKLWS